MAKCHWCAREGVWPDICMNTRDMEDNAIGGRDECFEVLAANPGLGEKGIRYVALNRIAERERSSGASGVPDRVPEEQSE